MKIKFYQQFLRLFIFLNSLTVLSLHAETSWTPPDLLFEENAQKQNPVLSMNAAGDAVIGWVNAENKQIEIAEYDYVDNKILSPTVIYPAVNRVKLLDVQLTSSKDLFLLWIDLEEDSLKAVRYDRQQCIWINSVSVAGARFMENPVLKMDGHTNALIGWTKFNGFEHQVQSLYYSSSASIWGHVITLSPLGFNCHLQKFTFDNEGNAVAVWKSTLMQDIVRNNNNYGIQAVRFSVHDQLWSESPFFFEALSDYVLDEPDILFDVQDNLIVLWKKVHRATRSEILQYISYDSKREKWGNKQDILTQGYIKKPKLLNIKEKMYALWQAECDGVEKLQCVLLAYPSGILSEIQTIFSLSDKITDYKIHTDARGKAKLIYSNKQHIGIKEFASQDWSPCTQFDEQFHVHNLQLQGDALGNAVVMWKSGNQVFFSHGDFLFAPTRLAGRVVHKRFAAKSIKLVQLTWLASKSPLIKGYRIRRNNELLYEIHCSQTQFLDRHSPKGDSIYAISTFNEENLESRPIEILIRN